MKRFLTTSLICLFYLSIQVVGQVSECPIETNSVLNAANEVCINVGRNQVCYGNDDVNVTPHEDTQLDFDNPGDIEEIIEIQALSLSSLDVENDKWGIALMRLLANLDPTASEDVTVLLFGDVEIEDASDKAVLQTAETNTYANIRRLPNATATVMDSTVNGQAVTVTGRLEDNSWVRVVNPESNIAGWILASLLNDVDFASLDIVSANAPYFAPMQAFYFQSGSDTLDCTGVPRNGIIIQTPEGLRRVTLWINEVTVEFASNTGSTASIVTEEDGAMSINMIEGSAFVSNEESGYVAVAGSSITVRQSDNGSGTEVSEPSGFDRDEITNLPIDTLGRDVEVPPPASYGDIVEANESLGNTSSNNGSSTQGSNNSNCTGDACGNGNQGSSDNGDQNSSNNNQDSSNNNQGSNTDSNQDSGNNDDCPGNSCNAPGQSGGDDCPGNSCNAPGHNKGNGKDDCPGNSCNAPGHNKDKDKGNGNGKGHGKGNGNNGHGHGKGHGKGK